MGAKVMRANQFILEDEDGTVRAALTVDTDGPQLILCDGTGVIRARLTVDDDGPQLRLTDETGKTIWSQP